MFITQPSLDELKKLSKDTLVEQVGIEFVEVGKDYLVAKMPVDHRTRQPMGLLHGGASVVLAESLGSIASVLCLPDPKKQQAVGLEINANHIKSVRSGWVYGKATPLHIGKRTHIWEIRIVDEQENLICISRLTAAIIEVKS